MELHNAAPRLSDLLPSTRYVEVQSSIVGARFGVWITTPSGLGSDPDRRYPAIYQPDANFAVPQTATLSALLPADPVAPIVPFIQVSVGYLGEDAERFLALRMRDLVPPGEPIDDDEASMAARVAAGFFDEAGAALYLHHVRHPAADAYLAFLTDELHPRLAADYPLDEDATGLHGYSYGGLFAIYAALRRTRFRRVGAGSPAIVAGTSTVLAGYAAAHDAQTDHDGRMLHVTVFDSEIAAPSSFQTLVGAGAAEFLVLAGQQPLPGLRYSSRILTGETHLTGGVASWFDFLRACYAAAG